MVRKTRQYTNPFLKANTHFLPVPPSTQQKLQKAMELHRQGQLDQAAKLYHQILEIDSGHLDALHLGGVVAHQLGNYKEAVRLIKEALKINSKVVNFHISLASSLKDLNQLVGAVDSYDKAIALKPDFAEAYFYRGCLLQDMGQLKSAADSYKMAVTHAPSFAEAYANLGLVLQELKEPKEAIACYEKAIALKPDLVEPYFNRGNAHHELQQFELAVISFGMAIELRPGYTAAYYNRGTALKDLNRFEEAVSSYDMAIQLKPDYAEAFSNRGVAQEKLKQLDAAMASYNQAINLKPDYAEAYCNLGNVFKEMDQLDAAVACYDQAIRFKKDYTLAYYNLGVSLHKLKQWDAAEDSFESAFAVNANSEWLIGMRLQAKMFLCDWSQITNSIALCQSEIVLEGRVILPFIALILFDLPELLLQTCKIYLQSNVIQNTSLGAISEREPKGRVRIGYYSADLYYHPASIWLAEQLENHDKSKVELYAFCLKFVQDPMRDRLEAAVDHWIDVTNLSDLEVTKLSRELGIDIAIDLNGHTADGRPGIFAARAAPIQVNHLGFPGSMGAEYIDYMLGQTLGSEEALEDWASTRPFITEKIAFVPSAFTYDRQRQISEEPLTRAQYGLPETGFVFTCQNGCQKLMPEVFDIWMEILKAVPGSVLWLLKPNETAVKNLIKEANARGVDAERLIFTAREVVSIDQEKARIGRYLASYKLADLFLDTWPYNAGTTAVDALWAGLPVLTKKGKALVARMATEALRGIEVPELITKTPEEYKELAIELAHNPDKLKQLKDKVQRNRLTTALFDPVANTRYIEDAYLEMYRRYQEAKAAEDFDIEAQNAN